MKMKFLLLSFLLITCIGASAQTDVFGNRIPAKKKKVAPIPANYNKTDAQGRKQGTWEKRYTDGSTLYKATFKDGHPVGKYTRFYPNKQKSLEIIYDENGLMGDAKLFNEDGDLVSSGKYKGKKKVGTWTYYTGKEVIASTEEYTDGQLNGPAKVYYSGGAVAEITNWVNGKKQGEWLKFFRNGASLLKAAHYNDKLEGKYLYYFMDGQLEIDGNYKNNNEDGNWTFYKANGKVNYILKYKNGTLLNPEVIQAIKDKERKEFEEKRATLKDPEKMRNNPEQFLQGR